MAMRVIICLLVCVALCGALREERPSPGRRLPHERRPGLSPLRRFIRKSTQDSLDLDILVTPGLDPCMLNDTKILVKTGDKQEKSIGELTDGMVFGLRGFDDFRQKYNMKKRLLYTTLAFELLEGAGKVALHRNDENFQLNVIAEMMLVIRSNLHIEDHKVSLSDSVLHRSVEPVVRLYPSKPINPRVLKNIGHSFIVQAEHCVRKKFVAAFEAGVNRALHAKNLTKVIDELRQETSVIHEFFHNATRAASKKVVQYMLDLKLPNIELRNLDRKAKNMTNGRVIEMKRPRLYFYNSDEEKHVYNLQLIIRKLVVTYTMNDKSLPYEFSNVQLFLQVRRPSRSSKLQILKAVVIGVEIPHPPRSLPLLLEINSKLYGLLMNFLEPQLKVAFINSLKM